MTVHSGSMVYVVDGDEVSRKRLSFQLHQAGYSVKAFASGDAFLQVATVLAPGCVLLDIRSPEAGGLAVARHLKAARNGLPVVVAGTSGADVRLAVQAMKAGAVEYLEVPHEPAALLAAIASALADVGDAVEQNRAADYARARVAEMSVREREVLAGLLAGGTNKVIGKQLGISPRTVELHRASAMERLGARTLPEAVLMASAAGLRPAGRSG
jgi:FixJ family two-component response regulator